MKDKIVNTLVGVLCGLVLLGATMAPTIVTRGEMQDYIEVTATEHLKLLREDLHGMREALSEVGQRLSAVEAVLRERQ
jgi:hypothetical protein